MGLVVGGSGNKVSQASSKTGKIRSNSGTGGGAAALREDLERSSGIGTGPSKGYGNTLANTLAEIEGVAPQVRSSSSRRVSLPSYGGVSGGTPVTTSAPQSSGGWSPSYASMSKPSGKVSETAASDFMDSVRSLLPRGGLYDVSTKMLGAPDPESWMSDDQDEVNQEYENLFRAKGMSEEDIDAINGRGNLFETAKNNPATLAATDNIRKNPWLDIDINELKVPNYSNIDESSSMSDKVRGVAGDTLRSFSESMFDENGQYNAPNIPERYTSDNSTSIGDVLTAIDDGKTMDYDHLTADRATGEAMQQYVEQGFGGRTWWEYSPYLEYLKSDEAQKHGFKSYLPDDRSYVNMGVTNVLDLPSDWAGSLGDARTRVLPSATIRYDVDNDPETTDDIIDLDLRDFNYRDTAYYHNMEKLAAQNPDIFLRRPENDEIHGAPVTTTVLENAVKNMNGDTEYAYGDIQSADRSDDFSIGVPLVDGSVISVPEKDFGHNSEGKIETLPDWLKDEDVDWDPNKEWPVNDDWTHYIVSYSDGSTIDVPRDEYDSWYKNGIANPKTFPARYVSIDEASGELPSDLDSLNEWYRENGSNEDTTWLDYPVQYTPDLVMADGTRLTYSQFMDIFTDEGKDKRPNDFAGTNVAYDYNLLNKPRSLMKNGGQLFNEDLSRNWDDFIPGAIDMTLGSLPISFDQTAWPLSVTQALSKSMNGLEANGYDSLTDSDMFISGEIDENTGELVPTVNDVNRLSAMAGNALIPLTENIAGNVSGRSFIPALSGDVPMNPTLQQLAKAWFLGNLGEGIEEIPGNVFDELTMYADSAYGIPIDSKTGEHLMKRDLPFGPLVPVRDENGDYKFVNKKTGEPITEKRDSMNHVYKDPNTSMADRFANFATNYPDLLNAIAGGYSVGGMMSIPNIMAVPKAVKETNYRKKMGLPQYVEPEEVERESINPEDIRRYLGVTE